MLHVTQSNPIRWANLYNHLYPLMLARKYKVPYVIWGHSLGPFVDKFSLSLTARVLVNAQLVAVRESFSYDIALQMGVPRKKVRLIPDPAFGIQPCYSERLTQVLQAHDLSPGDFIAVTVRQWKSLYFHHYLDGIAQISRRLVYKGFVKRIAIVVHTLGPIEIENDLVASKMLLECLRDVPVSLVYEDLSPEEMCALYGQSKFVIGTRFHSVILALAAGTPAYAISYFGPKAVGIMQDLGMGEWVTTLDDLKVNEVVDKVLKEDLGRKRKEIVGKVKQYREKLEEETELLVTLLRRENS